MSYLNKHHTYNYIFNYFIHVHMYNTHGSMHVSLSNQSDVHLSLMCQTIHLQIHMNVCLIMSVSQSVSQSFYHISYS